MASPDFDAVIVGAGAGGGVAAWVLASSGWRVALVEKGRNPFPSLDAPTLRGSLFGNDEIKARRNFAFQDPLVEPRTFRIGDQPGYGTGTIQALGVGVGGGTLQYDADSPRLQAADMTLRSTFGAVEGADVVDWPLTYAELAPYYDEVERLIGVQGLAGADPFAEPRGPYPMPPGHPARAEEVLAAGALALGLHPHPMPIAVNSIFYRGRPACANCGFCFAGCPINAKGSSAVTVIRDALLTGNLTLIPEACVTRVVVEPSGERAAGIRYVDAGGVERTLTAGHVVLAANALETPRLLLESAGPAHPAGLGNGSGLVGRYLMFHVVFSVIGVFDEEIRSYRGRVIKKALADWTVHDGSPDFVRGGYVELGGQIHPLEFGVSLPWFAHKEMMVSGRYRRNISSVSMMGEDLPQADNRVELDPEVRDVYGRAVPRITYRYHPHDLAMIDRYMPRMEEIALAAGAKEVMRFDMSEHYGVPETKHLLGTTRMGTDPAASVCDPWGRLHEVENVWVADGGTWPTSAAFNPVLTQQALACRTAARMVSPADPTAVLPGGGS
ncbi:MAG: GMC family oxidoreductase [Deltaproteobacteria bacterium]|nr:GMC family oxidoreductase [Deltaproteobacteria bacterium]